MKNIIKGHFYVVIKVESLRSISQKVGGNYETREIRLIPGINVTIFWHYLQSQMINLLKWAGNNATDLMAGIIVIILPVTITSWTRLAENPWKRWMRMMIFETEDKLSWRKPLRMNAETRTRMPQEHSQLQQALIIYLFWMISEIEEREKADMH